ncbi:MAG: FG-GAP-like repeat-containing protein [Bryobacteraceae bacterium]
MSNQLYHNRGNGTFEEVFERAGIAGHIGRGMSVASADYDGEGFTHIFVTNDNLPTFLFRNRDDATFEEVGLKPMLRCLNTQERLPAWESIPRLRKRRASGHRRDCIDWRHVSFVPKQRAWDFRRCDLLEPDRTANDSMQRLVATGC